MRLPRDVSGAALQASLRRLGYEAVRQRGSHIKFASVMNPIHHPRHFYKPQPVRPLEGIRADILALERETEGLLAEIVAGVRTDG